MEIRQDYTHVLDAEIVKEKSTVFLTYQMCNTSHTNIFSRQVLIINALHEYEYICQESTIWYLFP